MTEEPGRPAETDEPAAPDETISDLTLAELLAAAAEDLADVTVEVDGLTTTWSAGGRPFASLSGEWAEFHLAPAVARAALRMPDAAASPQGPDWVSFSPQVYDDAAIDRAEAWFLSAHRLATAPQH
ncbi:MAG: hypothetical protein H0V73_01340 [Chloroflexi bacterium]|nr:hypothetical protein [Chloroflexota bacterium]